MNPPLGNREDRAAIRRGVLDGTIALFATDHAPHTFESKSKGFLKAPFGVIGLETAIGVTWKAMVEEEKMSVMDWVSCWTSHPAMILRQPFHPFEAGKPADLVLIDPATPWVVTPETFHSKSRNCPFAGQTLHARPVMTICKGRTTWMR
jgi:dihydroorotase